MEARRTPEDELKAAASLRTEYDALQAQHAEMSKQNLNDVGLRRYADLYWPMERLKGELADAVPKLLAHVAALEAELALYRGGVDSLPLSAQDDVTDAMAAMRTERDRDHA